jgi:hypothetical protein
MKALYWLSNTLFGRLTDHQRYRAVQATCAAIIVTAAVQVVQLARML